MTVVERVRAEIEGRWDGAFVTTVADVRVLLSIIEARARVVEAARKVRDDADPMGGVRRGVVRFDESGDSSNDVTIGRGPHGTLLMANANDMQELHDALSIHDEQVKR